MFTKQDIEFMQEDLRAKQYSGTWEEVSKISDRIGGILDKLEMLAADHPVDEEAKVVAAKEPAAKKPKKK